MFKKSLVTAAVVVSAVGATLGAQAQTTYRAGSTPTGVPFTFLDTKTNSIQGVMVDLAQAIAKDQRIAIDIQGMPFSTLIPSLTSGKIDLIVAAVGMTPERQKVVDFTEPVYSYGDGMVVNTEDKGDYSKLDSLRGQIVGVQVGTVYVDPLKNTGLFKEVKVYDSLGDVMRDVALGRIKAGFGDYPIVAYQIGQGVHKGVRLVTEHQPLVRVNIGMAVRKGDQDKLAKVNASLKKLKADGTLDAIQHKWGLK